MGKVLPQQWHNEAVFRQLPRLCTQLGSLHELPTKGRPYAPIPVLQLWKQREVSIQPGPPLILFIHPDPLVFLATIRAKCEWN